MATANQKIELVSSKDSPIGTAGRKVDGVFTPSVSATSPNIPTITADSLQSQPSFNIPPVAPSTGLTGLSAALESESDAFTQNLERQRKQAEQARDTSRTDLVSTFRNQLTESEATVEAEDKLGVAGLEQDLIDINNEINAERMSRRRQIEALEKNPQGLFGGALEDKIADVERESIRKEADLSVIALARQGKFDAAEARASKAVDALMESQKKELDIAQFLYTENKDLFTTAEQREFETKQGDRVRKLNAEEADMKALQSAKLQALQQAQINGAPVAILSAIQEAKTPEEVISVGGQWGNVDMLDRAIKNEQLKSLRTKPEALRPTSVIDQGGRKLLIDTQTGEVIQDFGKSNLDVEELQQLSNEQAVKQVYDLRAHKGLNSSVGPVGLGRIALVDIFGAKDDFIAGIDNLTKDLTLDNLIKAKSEGATFGALSNAELSLLAESATKINNWRQGERGSDGSIISTSGYDASEKDFMRELDRIAYYRVLDSYKKGSTPEALGLATTPDNKIWFRNGDGSVTEIK